MHFPMSRKYNDFRNRAVEEFYLHIQPLLENEKVQKLDHYVQHNCHSRLSHSLDVAYYSFFIAKLMHCDSKSAARGGLLHDLYLYDREDEDAPANHLRKHPRLALENAREVTELNKVEENIIRRHMFLFTLVPPRYKEAYIVTFVDKFCAVREAIIGHRNRRRSLKAAPQAV